VGKGSEGGCQLAGGRACHVAVRERGLFLFFVFFVFFVFFCFWHTKNEGTVFGFAAAFLDGGWDEPMMGWSEDILNVSCS
jgi:hypothetical protein